MIIDNVLNSIVLLQHGWLYSHFVWRKKEYSDHIYDQSRLNKFTVLGPKKNSQIKKKFKKWIGILRVKIFYVKIIND